MADKKKYDYRLNVYVTAELQRKLEQVRDQRGPKVTVPDIVREALRQYLDYEEDVIGSRRHFQRNLREALDDTTAELTWQQIVLLAFVWQNTSALATALKAPVPPFKDSFQRALSFVVMHWQPLTDALASNHAELQKGLEENNK